MANSVVSEVVKAAVTKEVASKFPAKITAREIGEIATIIIATAVKIIEIVSKK